MKLIEFTTNNQYKIYWFSVVIIVIGTLNIGTAYARSLESNSIEKNFIAYIKETLFSESPAHDDFLSEYRSGTWSWNVSKLVNAYESQDISQASLASVIEISLPKVNEIRRYSNEKDNVTSLTEMKYLDRVETDYVKVYSKFFLIPNISKWRLTVTSYELTVDVYKKHQSEEYTI